MDEAGTFFRADDAGNAQLPGDNGSMAGAAAPVGDNSRGPAHDRFPVRVGHVGNQDFTRLKLGNGGRTFNEAGRALADPGAHCLSLDDNPAALLEMVGLDDAEVPLGMHGFRLSLDDIELAGADLPAVTILGPFNGHGPENPGSVGVMIFDDTGPSRQGNDFVIGQDIAALFFFGSDDGANRSGLIIGVDHFDLVIAHLFADNGIFFQF